MSLYSKIEIFEVNTGNRVAILTPDADGVSKCYIEYQLNGELSLSFELPIPNSKTMYINNSNYYIQLGTDFKFLPDRIEESRSDNNSTMLKAKYLGSFVELGQSFDAIVLNFSFKGYAQAGLTALLVGTNWTVGIVDVPVAERRIIVELMSRLEVLGKMRDLWGGDLVFDTVNRVVHLRAQYGQSLAVQATYGKNLKNVKRTTELNIITRLYPFGEGKDSGTHTRHNISSVNGGLMYIDNNSYSSRILEGTYVNTDFDDPTELKAMAIPILAALSKPRVSYECNLVDLSVMVGYELEQINVGDTIEVYDEDLQFNFDVRVVRKKWDIFSPDKPSEVGSTKKSRRSETLELELSNARKDLTADFSAFIRAGKVVDQTVNPGGYLPAGFLQGFINAANNAIKSANTRLRWTDGDLIAEEVDVGGVPTGKLVRFNSGGIGISTNSGASYTTAMTGAGIVADVITTGLLNVGLVNIVNAAGSLKIDASGLEIWDTVVNPVRKRVHLGEYSPGIYGLKVIARDGVTAIIDERGILQTWQVPAMDNVAVNFPIKLKTYLSGNVVNVRRALLNFTLEAFRAYSTGAASGGSGTVSSVGGGGTINTETSWSGDQTVISPNGGGSFTSTDGGGGNTVTAPDGIWNIAHPLLADFMNYAGSHDHGGATGTNGLHNHGIVNGTVLMVDGGGTTTFVESGSHAHTISTDGNHAHVMNVYHTHSVALPSHAHTITIPAHSHTITVPTHVHTITLPNHSHNVDLPSHTHGITYGIFESTVATGVGVIINGINRTAVLGGGTGFTTNQVNLDVSQYMAAGSWNTIELTSTQLGRINAVLYLEVFMEIS